MRVLFFGTPTLACSILEALIADHDIDVVGVVCQPDEPVGRKAILTAPPTKHVAMTHGIPVFQPTKLKDESFLAVIDALHADVAVVLAYGRILPSVLLNRIPHGFVNVHPSLLPKYRGPSPIQSAILAGDSVTGVSIMVLDTGMDTGALLAQSVINLAPDETSETLTKKVIDVSVPLLITTLKGFFTGSITPIPQSTEGVSVCNMLSREDGKISWNESVHVIDRKIRALNPWPGTSTTWMIGGKEIGVKIVKATVNLPKSPTPSLLPLPTSLFELRGTGGGGRVHGHIGIPRFESGVLLIDAADGTLEILELQPAGGNRMNGSSFARGYLKS